MSNLITLYGQAVERGSIGEKPTHDRVVIRDDLLMCREGQAHPLRRPSLAEELLR